MRKPLVPDYNAQAAVQVRLVENIRGGIPYTAN